MQRRWKLCSAHRTDMWSRRKAGKSLHAIGRALGKDEIVVPNPIRERLGLKPDTELEAIEKPEGVLLKRAEQRPSMVKIDGVWVHQGRAEPGADWERILEEVREDRIESVLKV